MNLRATDHPEFDAWRWNEYWIPLDVVIEFKRDVYQMALTELARFLPRGAQHNRYLRSGLRPHHREDATDHYRRSDAVAAPHRRRRAVAGDDADRGHADGARAADASRSRCRRNRWPSAERSALRRAPGCRGGSARARR